MTPSECLFLSNSSQSFQILLQIEFHHLVCPEDLRQAIAALARRMPALFCCASEGHFMAGPAKSVEIEQALVERCEINSSVVLEWLHQSAMHSWDLAREAPLRCLLVSSASHSLLAVMLHHGVCDGKTAVMLLNVLLDALNGHADATLGRVQDLPLSLEDLFDISFPKTFQSGVWNGPPRIRAPQLSLEHWVWSEERTQAFRQACRAQGLSCHSAFCTAASRVLRMLVQQKRPEEQSFSVHFPINVRDKIGLPDHAIGNLICFARIDEGGVHPLCFLEHASSVQARIQEMLAPQSLRRAVEELSQIAQIHGHNNPHSSSEDNGRGKPPEVHVMNLGKLDGLHHKEIQHLSIANYFAPRFFAEDHLAIMIFCWRNQLHFVMHYLKDHGDKFASSFVEGFDRTLLEFANRPR